MKLSFITIEYSSQNKKACICGTRALEIYIHYIIPHYYKISLKS